MFPFQTVYNSASADFLVNLQGSFYDIYFNFKTNSPK